MIVKFSEPMDNKLAKIFRLLLKPGDVTFSEPDNAQGLGKCSRMGGQGELSAGHKMSQHFENG